jgi:release factor glutamine methyltransferase
MFGQIQRLTTHRTEATLPSLYFPHLAMPISLGAALAATATRLAESSLAPELDAQWLLEHITGHNRTAQLRHAESLLSVTQQTTLDALIKRLLAGEPFAYVLGCQPFWTLELDVSPAVLIPRPDSELVVARALTHLKPDAPATLLDLGTGSGALALAVASERPGISVVATDQSPAALAVAQKNARKLGLTNVQFQLADWFTGLANQPFDLIVSNPPYIADHDTQVDDSVRQHEPHLALFAGPDGLDAFRRIVPNAGAHLRPGGWLVLEHGWQQAGAVQALLESVGFVGVASHADLAGHLRVTEGQWPHAR